LSPLFRSENKFPADDAHSEGHGSLYMPRTVLGGVWNLSGIVNFQSDLQIFGKPDVKGFLRNLALQNIDVEESHFFLPAGLPSRSSRQHGGIGPPSFHYGAAVFALHCVASEGWYARRGSNSQPSAPEADALSN
jgi:hypothetical protein